MTSTDVRTDTLDLPKGGMATPATDHSRRPGPDTLAAFGFAAAALICWAVSLGSFDLTAMSGLGLLNAAPALWFGAALLAGAPYLVLAVRGRATRLALLAQHAALVIVLFGTTAVLYPEPRFTWMYKHIGVVDYLMANGFQVDRTIDIYHNWPGFFYLSAVLAEAGISPITQARWAEVLFGFAIGWAVYYAVGALTRDKRLRWTTLALFTLTNWIGQGYYAPQAVATFLHLVFLGAALRAFGATLAQPAAADAAPPELTRRLVTRVLTRFGVTAEGVLPGSRPRWAPVIALAAFAALVVTHQLSPVAALFQLGALFLFTRFRPFWLLLVAGLLWLAWLVPAWDYLTHHTTLLNFNVTENVTMPGSKLTPSLPGMDIARWSGPVMMATAAMLALAGTIRAVRHRRLPLVPFVLAGSPVLILAANSYGSEAIFRVYLYALPWAAFLGAAALIGLRPPTVSALSLRRRRAETIVAGVLGVALVPLTLVTFFFLDLSNYVSRDDVAVATWFSDETETESFLALTSPSFPVRNTAAYPTHIVEDGAFAPAVTDWMQRTGRAEDAMAGADRIWGHYIWKEPGYLVFSPSQRNYALMWGQLSGSEYDRFWHLVEQSPDYELAYQHGDAAVFRHIGPSQPDASTE